MDIKNLILIGGGLLIAAVVAHGLWIAWRARRDPLRLKIDEKLIAAVADRDPVQADFPNGGARVVGRGEEPIEQRQWDLESEVLPAGRSTVERAAAERRNTERRAPSLGGTNAASGRAPDQSEGSATAAQGRTASAQPDHRPEADDLDWADRGTVAEAAVREAAAEQAGVRDATAGRAARGEPSIRASRESGSATGRGSADEWRSEIRVGEAGSGKGGEGLRAGVARRAQEAFKSLGNRPGQPRQGAGSGRAAGTGGQTPQNGAQEAPPEDLILINVLAPHEQPFTGPNLVAALRANGLRYGEMNIFHRIDPATSIHQFSVANVIEPGTFDMAEVEAFRTPGLCFFMRLPGPENPMDAFDDMQRVARDVAQRLGGELKDERRSVLTGQTVEHYRHRVAEFCRRRMSMRA